LTIDYWLLAIGYWLLAIGYWLFSIGYWLLATVHLSCFPALREFQKRPKWGGVSLRSCQRNGLEKLIAYASAPDIQAISFSMPLL
jgi:hypothetical protein